MEEDKITLNGTEVNISEILAESSSEVEAIRKIHEVTGASFPEAMDAFKKYKKEHNVVYKTTEEKAPAITESEQSQNDTYYETQNDNGKRKIITGILCAAIAVISIFVCVTLAKLTDYRKGRAYSEDNQDLIASTSDISDEPVITESPTVTEMPSVTEDPTPTEPEEVVSDVEITFRDIPWGTSYTSVNEMLGSLSFLPIAGEGYVSPSVDAVLLDNDIEGINFEYNDINIVASALDPELDVAGYTTSDVSLYFAYSVENGTVLKTEENSQLYEAQYRIEPTDLQSAKVDLIEKLSSLYGSPAKESESRNIFDHFETYTYWYGANDTELVLKTEDTSNDTTGFFVDVITISYAWRGGDTLLQSASDALAEEARANESNIYGNSSTDGL